MDPRIVAHRGWCREHLENSREALRAVEANGCRAVEFDVRRTGDGAWVVYHDSCLQRLHGHPQFLAQHSFKELAALAPLPLLDDVLAAFTGACVPLIEIKEQTTVEIDGLATIIARHRRRYELAVIARGAEMPTALAARLPHVPIYLYGRNWSEAARAAGPEIAGFDLDREGLDGSGARDAIAKLREGGRRIAVWTVNDAAECQDWLRAGADWVITDLPWSVDPARRG